MDIVILLLVIGVSILLIKCVNLQIENKKILKAKTAAENKSASQNKEIEKLKKNLVETKRAVDFYSNITEVSGGLNGGDFENAKANLGSPKLTSICSFVTMHGSFRLAPENGC